MVQEIFWPGGDDGNSKYVRYMHDYDLRGEPFSIDGMASSYMWNEFVVRRPTTLGFERHKNLGVLADGEHVTNRWTWASLQDGKDSRRDQTHSREGKVNMLFGDGRVRTLSLDEAANVPCDPKKL